MTISFERVAGPDVPWAELAQHPDRTVYQTQAWLDVLVATQRAEVVVARVVDGRCSVGWFTGAVVVHHGVRFLGSPLRGWTTGPMGFLLDDPTLRPAALAALPGFAFGHLGCIHLELADRSLDAAERPPGFELGHLPGYGLALAGRSDDELLAGMRSPGRRDVRRALRNGIVVEEVDPLTDAAFAVEYLAQAREAFAKRHLVPPFDLERVRTVLALLQPTGRLLALRARTADGEAVATGVFPGLPGATAEFWMGASVRRHQHLLPNEALMWQALRTWRDRGAVRFDFGGGGHYKAKYGGTPNDVAWVRRSRLPGLPTARQALFRAHRARQRLRGRRG